MYDTFHNEKSVKKRGNGNTCIIEEAGERKGRRDAGDDWGRVQRTLQETHGNAISKMPGGFSPSHMEIAGERSLPILQQE